MIVFNIKNVRKYNGISLNKLHEMTGISRAYLFDLENNRRTNPTTDTLQKIANALKVNVKKLFYSELDLNTLKQVLNNRIAKYGINSNEVLEVSQVIDLLLIIDMKKE